MAQKYEQASQKLPIYKVLFNNFIGGIAWGIGATVGVSIFFTTLGILSHQINFVPIIGSFVSQIIDFLLATNPNLK